jgi:hypothetical protein
MDFHTVILREAHEGAQAAQMSSAFSRTRCDHTVCLLEQNNKLVVQRGRYVSETIAPFER